MLFFDSISVNPFFIKGGISLSKGIKVAMIQHNYNVIYEVNLRVGVK